MKKEYLILMLILLFGCSNSHKKNSEEMYISSQDFYGIKNSISYEKLDSLISISNEYQLSKYQSSDSLISLALELLNEELINRHLDLKKLLVKNAYCKNDSVIIFELSHIDHLVYAYNLEKKNKDLAKYPDKDGMVSVIPPISGNLSGLEGWYVINTRNKTLNVSYAQ